MELRHLRYFVAVAEELNFRRAADRLHVAQPSLSRQVRELEEEIGERLLERDRRHVALTEAGRALLSNARDLLAGAEEAITAAREAGSQARGGLRLGTIGSLSASFLPRSLAALREQFPRVEIEILELEMDEQRAALLAGTIQLGFQVRIPGMPVDPRFSVRPVIDCGVSVALPARHPLAVGRTVSLKVLGGEMLLNLQPSPGAAYGRWVRAVCEQEGAFTPRFRRGPLDNSSAMLGLVAAGEGLAFFPATMIKSFPHSGDWTSRPLCPPRIRFVLDAVWNPANPSRIVSSYLSLLPQQSTAPNLRGVQPARERRAGN